MLVYVLSRPQLRQGANPASEDKSLAIAVAKWDILLMDVPKLHQELPHLDSKRQLQLVTLD